jgi:hypothetical protein
MYGKILKETDAEFQKKKPRKSTHGHNNIEENFNKIQYIKSRNYPNTNGLQDLKDSYSSEIYHYYTMSLCFLHHVNGIKMMAQKKTRQQYNTHIRWETQDQ